MVFSFGSAGAPLNINAPAKVNLCLQILGKRQDGYHNMLSFVGFTQFGDLLTAAPSPQDKLMLSGPFADALGQAGGETLISQALSLLRNAGLEIPTMTITLDKHIPLGGGLGGGSTDAAAFLRLVQKMAKPDTMLAPLIHRVSCQLGADVLACLQPGYQLMRGIGTDISPISITDKPIYCVLANPHISISTSALFKALPPSYSHSDEGKLRADIDGEKFHDIIATGNDLETTAITLFPKIAPLLAFMRQAHPDLIGAGMSGSGACCFALIKTPHFAKQLVDRLHQKNYWAVKTQMIT